MGEFVPMTFEDAVGLVSSQIGCDTVTNPGFHFSGGMAMRNSLGLWDRHGLLHKHMVERFGLCHADDMSMLISHAAHAKKNGLEYDPAADVEVCKNHWLRLGMNPATMENLKEDKPNDHLS